jgi:2-hydroxy-6-oxonona-2,4-dienedioate hydrolase
MEGKKETIKFITIKNGECLAYREHAGPENSELLLLIHGDLSSSYSWEKFAKKLSENYSIIALDMRGFGYSSYKNKINSIYDIVEDTMLFLTELSIKKCSVMGYSAGGIISLLMAIKYPLLINKVILLAPIGLKGIVLYKMNQNLTVDFSKRIRTKEDLLDSPFYFLLKALQDKDKETLLNSHKFSLCIYGGPSDEEIYKSIDEGFLQRNNELLYLLLNFNISSESNEVEATGEIEKLKHKVLILHGKNDLTVCQKEIEEMSRAIGLNSTVKYFDSCGHNPLYTHEKDVLKQINLFLLP